VINSLIGTRYRLGLRSAAAHGQIAKDLGQFGEGEAVQHILDGTDVFPPDTDPEIVALLEEVAFIRAEMDQLSTAELQNCRTRCDGRKIHRSLETST
jgi:hypothetical protein